MADGEKSAGAFNYDFIVFVACFSIIPLSHKHDLVHPQDGNLDVFGGSAERSRRVFWLAG